VVADSSGDQYVITGSSDGHLYAVNATSGSSAWSQSLGNSVVQLAVGDGWLLAITETSNDSSGTLTAYPISANQ
jgi:outer membrane protein assembly factor BamB